MTYLDHDYAGCAEAEIYPCAGGSAIVRPDAVFARVEWDVIFLARHEKAVRGWRASFAGRLLYRLFGVEQPTGLADPRLESLRRVSIDAWRSVAPITPRQSTTLLLAGFHPGQIALLNAYICGERTAGR